MTWVDDLIKKHSDMPKFSDGKEVDGSENKEDKADFNLASLLGAAVLGGTGFFDTDTSVGYQGSIPEYTAVRAPIDMSADVDRRPGSGGRRYFSDVVYAPTGGIETAVADATAQAEGLGALNAANPYRRTRPVYDYTTRYSTRKNMPKDPATGVINLIPSDEQKYDIGQGLEGFKSVYAEGGIAKLAKGRYLDGGTDGMTDEVRANIDGVQEARLSDGEYVIPADVVSHLGNGNSDAGAKVLDKMLSRVRKARTGNSKQGKQINPEKMLPA